MLQLKESAKDCLDFFHHVQPARLPAATGEEDDLLQYDAEEWSMGDLPRLKELANSLRDALSQITHRASDEEKAAKTLEGSLLRSKCRRLPESGTR